MSIQEKFERLFPDYRGKVVFTKHAQERFFERFGDKFKQRHGRAIIRAIRALKDNPRKRYASGETWETKFVVSQDSGDGKYVVVTCYPYDWRYPSFY